MKSIFTLLFLLVSAQLFAYSNCTSEALALKKQGDYVGAIKLLNNCLVNDSDDNVARLLLAELYFLSKDIGKGQEQVALLKAKGADLNEVAYKMCMANQARNNYKLVTQFGDEVLVGKLNNQEKIIFLDAYGKALYKNNMFPKAKDALEQLVIIDPNNSDAYQILGDYYNNVENYKQALIYYKKSAELDSTNPKKLLTCGDACFDAGDKEGSIGYYRKAEAAGYVGDLAFFHNVAYAFYDLKDFPNTLVMINQAKEISPYDIDVAYLEAYTYYNMNKLAEARLVADKMLELNPDNANMVYFIGMTFQKEGKQNKAEYYFEKAIKMKPDLERLKVSQFNWDGRKL